MADLLADARRIPGAGGGEQHARDREHSHVQRALDHLVEVAGENAVVDDLADRQRDQQVEDHLADECRLREQEPLATGGVGPNGGQQLPEVRRAHRATIIREVEIVQR
jgi:hypothetical protein